MKKLLTCAAVLFVQLIYAQTTTTLYGLSYGQNSNGFFLASLDPQTGLVTEISPSPIASVVVACYATIDPVNNIYYFSKPDSLVGVNISTGQIVSQVQCNLPANYYFEMPQYNCRDSLLYGMYRTSGSMQLATIDPLTGIITVISPSSIDPGFVASTKGSLDPDAGVYLFHGILGFHSVSLATGLVLSTVNPTFTGPGTYFELSLWDCEDSVMYGMNRDVATSMLYPATMNLQTGAVTNITSQGISTQGFFMCTAEINSPVDLFHYSDVSGFKTINMTSGNVLGSVPFIFSPVNNVQYLDLIARDNCKCALTPIGIEEARTSVQLEVSPNPVQGGADLYVKLDSPVREIQTEVFDIGGRLVTAAVVQTSDQSLAVSTSNLAPGTYMLRLINNNQQPVYTKFIIY
ncbi:MAG: T9SS type A sorting domain-containing protein [Bacteroidia bacterium]